MVTIDTSVLLAVLLNEKHKEAVIKATEGHDLVAPACVDAEIGNALSAMFKRKRISIEDAILVLKQFNKIPIRRTKLRLSEAASLAFTHNIYAYDAYVLDCARQYRSPLLSLDHKLVEVAKQMDLTLLEVSK